MRLGVGGVLGGVCAVALGALLAALAAAETPSGAYAIPIAAESGLVVPTGDGQVCQQGVCVSTSVTTDTGGMVSGTGHVTISDPNASVDLDLLGRVSGTTARPKLVLAFSATGQSAAADLAGKGKLKCAASTAAGLLDCKGKARLCASMAGHKLGCEKLPFATQVAFQRQSFQINLDLQTVLTTTVSGEANVAVGALTLASYAVKGRYKPGADASNLALVSATPGAKSRIALKKVVLSAGAASAGTAVFRIMGQKGVAQLPSVSPLSHPTCVPAGSFCDVNQATASLFTQPTNPQLVIDNTIFFGILDTQTLAP